MSNKVQKVNSTLVYKKGAADRFVVHLPINTPPIIPLTGETILATEIDEQGNEHIRMSGVVNKVIQSHSHSMPTDTFAYIVEIEIQ